MKKVKKTEKKQIKCPYCGSIAVLRDGEYVHGKNAYIKKMYVCSKYPKCDSYVSAHESTQIPMGTLANGDLRNKRIKAHKTLELMWIKGVMTKKNTYRWLQVNFCLDEYQCHIGQFSEYMCDELIALCKKTFMNNNIAC